MKQLVQQLKNGQMEILDIPTPILGANMVLVQNHYSLISAGTEGSTVIAARKGLAGKAMDRPQQVKQVIDTLKEQGPVQTYRTVMKKLEAYSPLGYSCAGQVIRVGGEVNGFSIGDMVAFGGGGYASHAELVAVPKNLCVKVPQDADMQLAAYNTVGAIALQGIRQADLRIGETCAVIGLGLIGQLTACILQASGVQVIGIDIIPTMTDLAGKHCADLAICSTDQGLAERIEEFTYGIGVDGVIITAAAKSLEPVNMAGKIARKKARIVIVGDVPTGFDREPYYYRKELEVRMSCSYGPGRYDLNYEEKGLDYPAGYVRWTENRNMTAFQQLIHSGKIDIAYLTTHVFPFEQAQKAYDIIVNHTELFLGIILKYDISKSHEDRAVILHKLSKATLRETVRIAFIGAGSYAMGQLLPHIPRSKNIIMDAVMTASGTSARTVAEKYGFSFCTSNEADIFDNPDINTLFIATRHNSHAEYVKKALSSGKSVFVEKPLALTQQELNNIAEIIKNNNKSSIMVGFNRRFSELTEILKGHLTQDLPIAMLYRVNAGKLQSDHWIQDKDIGGGRIIGEVCHFIDWLTFMNGSLPKAVFANVMESSSADTITVNLYFQNGSIGTICYFCNGSKSVGKEYIEVYQAGQTGIIRDFKVLEIHGTGKPMKKKLLSQNKGQKSMIKSFISAVQKGSIMPISFEEIYAVTHASFKILDSLSTNSSVSLR